MKLHLTGLAMGLAVGLIDCVLFSLVEGALPLALIATAVTFWTTVGWAVHVAPLSFVPVLKGIVVSWFMNIPWFIEYVALQGQNEMAIPMIGLATVFGALLGLVSGFIHKHQPTGRAEAGA